MTDCFSGFHWCYIDGGLSIPSTKFCKVRRVKGRVGAGVRGVTYRVHRVRHVHRVVVNDSPGALVSACKHVSLLPLLDRW